MSAKNFSAVSQVWPSGTNYTDNPDVGWESVIVQKHIAIVFINKW